jgi:hypothetical protein
MILLEERHRMPITYQFCRAVVMSPTAFEALPTVADGDAHVFAPGQKIKVLIPRDHRTRWHLVEIERHVDGVDLIIYRASEITIRAYQPE